MALAAASRYTIEMRTDEQARMVAKKVPGFMALSEYSILRKAKGGQKQCDIRPFVKEAEVTFGSGGWRIEGIFLATAQGSLKPSLWMKSLCALAGMPEIPYIAFREAILCQARDGTLVPMEDYCLVE